MKKVILFCLPFLLLACKQSTSNETIVEETFAIYTLTDSTVNSGAAMEQSIERTKLLRPDLLSND